KSPPFHDPAVICRIAQLFIETDRHIPAVEDCLSAAQLAGPLLRLGDHKPAKPLLPVLRENDDPPEHHRTDRCAFSFRFLRKLVQPAGGDRKVIVKYYNIFCIRGIVFVELLTQSDVVLPRHRLNAHIICARLLPCLCCSHNLKIHIYFIPFAAYSCFFHSVTNTVRIFFCFPAHQIFFFTGILISIFPRDPGSFPLVKPYCSRVPRIYIQRQFSFLLLHPVQEALPDPPALRLTPDENSCNIFLIQSDKSLDLLFVLIYIYIHFRLRNHFSYSAIISLPVFRRYKIVGFQVCIQPDFRDSVYICCLHFSDHTQTSLSKIKLICFAVPFHHSFSYSLSV